jgi:hypothetical protein
MSALCVVFSIWLMKVLGNGFKALDFNGRRRICYYFYQAYVEVVEGRLDEREICVPQWTAGSCSYRTQKPFDVQEAEST